MVNKFESNFDKSWEKFPHLWMMSPEISSITNLDPNNVKPEHLSCLDEHLFTLEKQFPNIAWEITPIRRKIAILTSSPSNLISWEIMKAANDSCYTSYNENRPYRSVS